MEDNNNNKDTYFQQVYTPNYRKRTKNERHTFRIRNHKKNTKEKTKTNLDD